MYSFILEATRILNIWTEYIFGTTTKPTDITSHIKPHTTIRHIRKAPKLISLPDYKGDADEQYNFGRLYCSIENYNLAFHWYRPPAPKTIQIPNTIMTYEN